MVGDQSELRATQTTDPVLQGRAGSEAQWISQIKEASANHSVIIPWEPEEIKGYDRLKTDGEIMTGKILLI